MGLNRLLCSLLGVFILSVGAFASTQAHAFCDPPNLLIVLDRSGSMITGNKWTDAKQAINTVTGTQQTKVRFGLETFSDKATIDAPLPSSSATIKTALNKLKPLGQTFMVPALGIARSHLISVLNADAKKGRPTNILFITDGEPSDRCPSAEVSALRSVTVGGIKYDIKTYVIGFGSLVNRTCLNDMATRGGTSLGGSIRYYVANNASDLITAINKIITSSLKKSTEVCDGKDNDCDGLVDESLRRTCYNNKCRGAETCKAGKWVGCTAPPTRTETCDNKDNDCDGSIDESLTQACSYKCGSSTRTGTERCSRGKWYGCTANPKTETCDNKDNDCDGAVDENLRRTCYNHKCRGSETCTKGKWAGCTAPATKTEVCDNKDNDCDGRVDESLKQACVYKCAGTNRTGTEYCSRGKWYGCTAKSTSEKCDNIDNDCDGSIDEGLTKSCRDSKTRCLGKSTCQKGKWGSCKAGAPGTETCNNLDDDCDGRVDENVTRACVLKCAGSNRTGTERCYRGKWYGCTARATSEKCDNIDNDCDGQIDEKLVKGCTDSKTRCRGSSTCSAGKWGSCVAAPPTKEICDRKDNDCDGRIDESLVQACSRTCGNSTITGTERCSNGKWYGCTAVPVREICDNKDNNCNKQIDENLSKACGKCGTQVCKTGKWGSCVEAKRTPEICDNKDNDCNGKVDDNLTKSCNYKTCKGSQTCSRGRWSSCRPPVEKCNGKDDDCDGRIDENWPDKNRVCGAGLGICYRTGRFSCKPDGSGLECNVKIGQPSKEVCDAKDNDCDGKNDEDLKRTCFDKCLNGNQECKEGSWTTCVPNPGGKVPPEKCGNGKDDDCDGSIDEGCVCKPGSTRACGNGVGECKQGTQKCLNDAWSKECVGAKGPQQEVCNGKDDDCDGEVDESITRICKTACGDGVQACIRGDWRACSGGYPQPEICNGLDDDCDGVVDNGATGSCGDRFGCTEGGCRPKCRNGECPGGQRCLNDICVSKDCRGVRCPSGYQCEKGVCRDLCTKTQCPSGLLCRRGRCLPKDCYAYGCESGKACVSGKCVTDPCSGKTCTPGQFCRAGKCVTACQCAEDELCVNDKCVFDPCDTVTCDGALYCRAGKCEKRCATKCHDGQFCQDGQCTHNPCTNIQCPIGSKCHEGQCTNRIPPPPPPLDPELTNPDGGDRPDRGGFLTDGNGNGNTDKNGNKNADKNDPNTEDPNKKPKGDRDLLSGEQLNGDGDLPGCGCQLKTVPTNGFLWLTMFFVFLGFQRRKKQS